MKHIIPPLPFLKNRKKCPWKKSPDCVHLWVKFCIRNVVLTVSWRKNSKIFLSRVFLSCFWRNVCRSVLVPWNLLCLEKFLVARLHEEIILKSMSQTKKKCDSLVLSRSYLWMVWRCHGILRVYRYYFCFRTNGRKGHLDENDFRYSYGNFI